MSDAWQEIQAVKSKRNSLREKLQKRKIERQVILSETADKSVLREYCTYYDQCTYVKLNIEFVGESLTPNTSNAENESDFDWSKVGGERVLLETLIDMSVNLPFTSHQLVAALLKKLQSSFISHSSVVNLLYKFAAQNLIR